MEARLAKVRQRKIKQGEGKDQVSVDIAEFDFDKRPESTSGKEESV